mgnify:CR=1 FL=1
MSDMLERYEESTAPIVVDARSQAAGTREVNFFDTETVYQDEFTTGAAAQGPAPVGNFTDDAKEHYDQEVTELSNVDLGHHTSNASNSESHYATKHENAAGIVYQSTVG